MLDNPMALPYPSPYWNERDAPPTDCSGCGAELCDRAVGLGSSECCACAGEGNCPDCFTEESEDNDE